MTKRASFICSLIFFSSNLINVPMVVGGEYQFVVSKRKEKKSIAISIILIKCYRDIFNETFFVLLFREKKNKKKKQKKNIVTKSNIHSRYLFDEDKQLYFDQIFVNHVTFILMNVT